MFPTAPGPITSAARSRLFSSPWSGCWGRTIPPVRTPDTCRSSGASMSFGCRVLKDCATAARTGALLRWTTAWGCVRRVPSAFDFAREAGGRPAQQVFRDIRAAAESGWDFSSRWFADGHQLGTIDTTEIVPVDLNSLLFGLENAIRVGCEQLADHDCAGQFARRAARRHAAIDHYLWDASSGAYLDYHR